MAETSGERARRMRSYVGKRVRIRMAGSDVYELATPVELVGQVKFLALRMKGSADWRDSQYDMVLMNDQDLVMTFALSRIQEIDEVP